MLVLKNLSKAITKKNYVWWFKMDDYDYIVAEHWALKTNQNLKGSALTALVKMFNQIPNTGTGLCCTSDKITDLSKEKMDNAIKLFELDDLEKLEYTELIHKGLCIFRTPDKYVYLDKKYTDLVKFEEVQECGEKNNAVYFINDKEALMVLRMAEVKQNKYLK